MLTPLPPVMLPEFRSDLEALLIYFVQHRNEFAAILDEYRVSGLDADEALTAHFADVEEYISLLTAALAWPGWCERCVLGHPPESTR